MVGDGLAVGTAFREGDLCLVDVVVGTVEVERDRDRLHKLGTWWNRDGNARGCSFATSSVDVRRPHRGSVAVGALSLDSTNIAFATGD